MSNSGFLRYSFTLSTSGQIKSNKLHARRHKSKLLLGSMFAFNSSLNVPKLYCVYAVPFDEKLSFSTILLLTEYIDLPKSIILYIIV